MRVKSKQTSVYQFEDHISVECPKCAKEAIVTRKDDALFSERNCRCGHCGFSNEWNGDCLSYFWHEGEMFDPAFHYKLFFQSNVKGHQLWAFNRKHLSFLENWVGANLREKSDQNNCVPSTLETRLPKWMISHKNREAVLKALKKLKSKS
jgi:predicted RNA-binding Zn-ribbon protein involved in translation (DUF1610 family)